MTLSNLKDILRQHNAKASKKWSQNFLYDDRILDRIISYIPKDSGYYIEIGGGAGTLTERAIHKGITPLTVLDLDDDMLKILDSRFGDQGDVKIVEKDGSKIRFEEFYSEKRGVVFGNLPYQVSSPIMLNTFYQSKFLEGAVFLVQKEVAEKIEAAPGERMFSPLAAMATLLGTAELLFSVPPEAFHPAPKVWSSLIKFKFNEHDFDEEYLKKFASVVRIIFSHRRKTLNNVFKINRLPKSILEELSIPKTTRIEELGWDTFQKLAKKIIDDNSLT